MQKQITAITILLACLLPSYLFAAPLTLKQSREACCRILIPSGGGFRLGSGTVFHEGMSSYYAITSGHVTRGVEEVYVDFCQNGKKSNLITASLVWEGYQKGTSIDVAVIAIKKSHLSFSPRVIQFCNNPNVAFQVGDKIMGSGYPNGTWLQSWYGIVQKVEENIVRFNSFPESGQSGTALLVTENDETRIGGLLTWKIGNALKGHGGGVHNKRLREIFAGVAQPDEAPLPASLPFRTVADKVSVKTCNNCGLPREYHHNTSEGLRCHLCQQHGRTYQEHSEHEKRMCFPWLFGGGQRREVPPTPKPDLGEPSPELPPELFPDDSERYDRDPDSRPTQPNTESLVDRIGRLLKSREELENKYLLAKEKIGKLEQKYLGATNKLDDALAKVADAKDKLVHPLDKYTGDNGEVAENLALTGLGGGLGIWLYSAILQPFMIRRFGSVPTWLLLAVGKRGVSKIVDRVKKKE